MPKKAITIQLHQDIRKSYNDLASKMEYGVQKYSSDYIINTLAHKYYKSPKTIENIVFRDAPKPVES